MLEALGNIVKSKEGRATVLVLGTAFLVLGIANHWHNIKLTKIRIKQAEAGN